ncbi:response regulator transcription factor [Eubacterium limosum]|uniref:response regulator transcription factor n=1 Tax=Eubacterium limosum TaxID=1736 RepID=UPI003710A17C
MESINILIVEDDVNISNMLVDLLTHSGYTADTAYSGTEALFCLEKKSYALILLDLMLPGMSGEEVLKSLRQTSDTLVIAVSAKDDSPTKISLLKNGADDYITKPFNNEELLARIEALLRRNSGNTGLSGKTLTYKGLTLNPSTYEVYLKGQPLSLTKREYKILELLMQNPQRVFSKNVIYETVWEDLFLGEDNAINVHISNLRQKLAKIDPDEAYIQTVWGIGFKMK